MTEYKPNCEECKHFNNCIVRKELKEKQDTIFNLGREKAGRKIKE